MSISRYHDIARKSLRSRKLALEALENYNSKPEEHWLSVALRHFETAERYQSAKLKLRLELKPDLHDRIASDSYPKSA